MSTITERCRCGAKFSFDDDEETRSYCEACTLEESEAAKADAAREHHAHDAFDAAGDR